MNFDECLKKYILNAEKQIEKEFSKSGEVLPQQVVFDAMEYAIRGGGKRIRPVLVQAAAELCGANPEDSARVALAVECIHNYSLIHDDLPCMDDDDLRRGRATCHVVYGEDTALLAGDGLLNLAFEILSDASRFSEIPSERLLKIIKTLSDASGARGMIGGQVVDLGCEDRSDATADELVYLHKHKTGALIRGAVVCGCLCGKDEAERNAEILGEYAEKLGLAFQIKDDILDVIGEEELLGKPIGSDADEGKNTFVTMFGLEEAQSYLDKITNEAKRALEPLGERGWFFSELADFLLCREY